jgi:hypothetical protein
MTQVEFYADESVTKSQFSRRLAAMRLGRSAGAPARDFGGFSKVDFSPKFFGLRAKTFFLDQPGLAGSGTTSPLTAKF